MDINWQKIWHAAKVAGVATINAIPRIRKLADGTYEVTWAEPRLALPAPGQSGTRHRAVMDAPDAESAQRIADALKEADERAKTKADADRAADEQRAQEARHARANLIDAKDAALQSMQTAEDEARRATAAAKEAKAEADQAEAELNALKAEISDLESRTASAQQTAAKAVTDRAEAQKRAREAAAAKPELVSQVTFLKAKLAEATVAEGAAAMVKDYTFLGGMHQLMVLPKPTAKRGRKVNLSLADSHIFEPNAENRIPASALMVNGLPHPTLGNGYGFLVTKNGTDIEILVEHNPTAFDVRTETDEETGAEVTSLYALFPEYTLRVPLS